VVFGATHEADPGNHGDPPVSFQKTEFSPLKFALSDIAFSQVRLPSQRLAAACTRCSNTEFFGGFMNDAPVAIARIGFMRGSEDTSYWIGFGMQSMLFPVYGKGIYHVLQVDSQRRPL